MQVGNDVELKLEQYPIEMPFELGDHVRDPNERRAIRFQMLRASNTSKLVITYVSPFVRTTMHSILFFFLHFFVRQLNRPRCVRTRARDVPDIQIRGKWTEKPAIIKQFIHFSSPGRGTRWHSCRAPFIVAIENCTTFVYVYMGWFNFFRLHPTNMR